MTQGEQLVHGIRSFRLLWRRWPTYGDLQAMRISTAPHKRLAEPGHKRALRRGEQIARRLDRHGRVVFAIVRIGVREA